MKNKLNNLKWPNPFCIHNNLEKIAEKEGHQRRLIFDTPFDEAARIITDMQKARYENNEAYWNCTMK